MLKAFLIPASLYFIIFSVFVELSYVLVQYEVYIWNFKYIKYTPFFITLLLLLIFFTLNYKKEKIIEWEKFIYPLMLLGISLISIQPKYTNEVNLDIFEGANHGISIYEYFNYALEYFCFLLKVIIYIRYFYIKKSKTKFEQSNFQKPSSKIPSLKIHV
jgi:hypothetical protein